MSVLIVHEPVADTVQITSPGPQGISGQGILVGLESEKPGSPSEGTVFSATDTNKVYIYIE